MQSQDYREVLKRHLAERMEDNPRYSLRAFSRDLCISPSRLSEILSGKQGLSEAWAKKIANALQMNARESEEFCQRVLASDGRAKKIREEALSQLEKGQTSEVQYQEYQTLQFDVFKIIADWYHFAILELTKVKNFKSDPQWIANKLKISEFEVKLAIERLIRLNLLQEKSGQWIPTNKSLTTTLGIPSEAIRKFNKQIIEKSKEAVTGQSIEERDISTLTVAVRHSDLPWVMERIKKFRRDLNAELAAVVPDGSADEVYSLALQFFRLTAKETQ